MNDNKLSITEQIFVYKKLLKSTPLSKNDCSPVLSTEHANLIERSGLDMERALDKKILNRRLATLIRQRRADIDRQRQDTTMLYVPKETLKRHREYLAKQNEYLVSQCITNPSTGKPFYNPDGSNMTLPTLQSMRNQRYAEHIARTTAMITKASKKSFAITHFTIGAPGRFHTLKEIRSGANKGKLEKNPMYKGATVREAYEFLDHEMRTVFRRLSNDYISGEDYFFIKVVLYWSTPTGHLFL